MFIYSENSENNLQNESAVISSLPVVILTFLSILTKVMSLSTSVVSLDFIITLIENSVLPIISGMIAYSVGGVKALLAGLMGGIITNSGITILGQGGIQGFSGLYGCLTAGKIAGKSFVYIKRILALKSKDKNTASILPSIISIGITILSAVGINEISAQLNSFTIFSLSDLSASVPLLTCVLTGMAVSTNSFGAVYMGGYLFATAAFTTGQSELMTSVFAATLIPSISIATISYLYKSKIRKSELSLALCSLLGGLFGAKYSSAPFFIAKPFRVSVSCIAGGCVSSLLCTLFKCKCGILPKSIFSLIHIEKPMFFLLSVICGVLVCVFIMSLLFDTQEETENEKKKEVKAPIEIPA